MFQCITFKRLNRLTTIVQLSRWPNVNKSDCGDRGLASDKDLVVQLLLFCVFCSTENLFADLRSVRRSETLAQVLFAFNRII